jgi:hypothetical protein
MYMKSWFAIFAGSEDAHPHHLMGSINGQDHRFRRSLFPTPRADNDVTTPNSTHQNSLSYRHSLLLGKPFNTFGYYIPILQPYHENPANSSFTCFHVNLLCIIPVNALI